MSTTIPATSGSERCVFLPWQIFCLFRVFPCNSVAMLVLLLLLLSFPCFSVFFRGKYVFCFCLFASSRSQRLCGKNALLLLKTLTAKTQRAQRKTSQEKMPPPLFASPWLPVFLDSPLSRGMTETRRYPPHHRQLYPAPWSPSRRRRSSLSSACAF